MSIPNCQICDQPLLSQCIAPTSPTWPSSSHSSPPLSHQHAISQTVTQRASISHAQRDPLQRQSAAAQATPVYQTVYASKPHSPSSNQEAQTTFEVPVQIRNGKIPPVQASASILPMGIPSQIWWACRSVRRHQMTFIPAWTAPAVTVTRK